MHIEPVPAVYRDFFRNRRAQKLGEEGRFATNLRHCGQLVSNRVISTARLDSDWLQHFRGVSVGTLSSQTAPTNQARRVGDKHPSCEFVINEVAEQEQKAFGRPHLFFGKMATGIHSISLRQARW